MLYFVIGLLGGYAMWFAYKKPQTPGTLFKFVQDVRMAPGTSLYWESVPEPCCEQVRLWLKHNLCQGLPHQEHLQLLYKTLGGTVLALQKYQHLRWLFISRLGIVTVCALCMKLLLASQDNLSLLSWTSGLNPTSRYFFGCLSFGNTLLWGWMLGRYYPACWLWHKHHFTPIGLQWVGSLLSAPGVVPHDALRILRTQELLQGRSFEQEKLHLLERISESQQEAFESRVQLFMDTFPLWEIGCFSPLALWILSC